MSDLIEKLSNLRSQFNCFDENKYEAYRTLSEAIKVISERPNDAVSRADVLESFADLYETFEDCSKEIINELHRKFEDLRTLPSVTPKRKTGKWITESLADDFAFVYSLKCSECGKYYGWEHNFCPNCGADMR